MADERNGSSFELSAEQSSVHGEAVREYYLIGKS